MKKIALLILLSLLLTLAACAAPDASTDTGNTASGSAQTAGISERDTDPATAGTDAGTQTGTADTESGDPGKTGGITHAEGEHTYTASTVEPTLTKQGYVLHTCECGDQYMDQFTGLSHTQEVKKPTLKILFIGNSYTNRSSLWNLVKSVAADQGYSLTVDSVVQGAWTLLQMADPADEFGSKVDSKLKTKSYDIVFLQEQSERPATEPGMFYDGVRALDKKVRAAGATPVLFQTWGRKAGSATLTKNGWSDEEMTRRLAASYEAIGKECGITVSPVGTAFLDVYKHHPEIEIYDSDLSHPTPAGSYLAALCHYAVIYGKSPVGISYRFGVSSAAEAKILQQAAHKAVFGERLLKENEIPDSSKVFGATNGVSLKKIPSGSQLISAGITGDKGVCASSATAASGSQLTAAQLADLADIGYGVSIIGTKDMVNPISTLIDGNWSKKIRTSYHFADGNKHYGIDGVEDAGEKYRALITLNFGKTVTVDAIGYCSGSLGGFAQAQDLFISDDGITWAKVESASYTTTKGLPNVADVRDASNGTSTVSVLFDAGGVKTKYLRLGIATGVVANDWDMNTLEFVVYGKK